MNPSIREYNHRHIKNNFQRTMVAKAEVDMLHGVLSSLAKKKSNTIISQSNVDLTVYMDLKIWNHKSKNNVVKRFLWSFLMNNLFYTHKNKKHLTEMKKLNYKNILCVISLALIF